MDALDETPRGTRTRERRAGRGPRPATRGRETRRREVGRRRTREGVRRGGVRGGKRPFARHAPPRTSQPRARRRRRRGAIAGGAPTWRRAEPEEPTRARVRLARARARSDVRREGRQAWRGVSPDEPNRDPGSVHDARLLSERRPLASAKSRAGSTRLVTRGGAVVERAINPRASHSSSPRPLARAGTMEASQPLRATAASSFPGDTMPHVLSVRARPPPTPPRVERTRTRRASAVPVFGAPRPPGFRRTPASFAS